MAEKIMLLPYTIDNNPGASCFSLKFSSLNSIPVPPYILQTPVPSPYEMKRNEAEARLFECLTSNIKSCITMSLFEILPDLLKAEGNTRRWEKI